jgi:hypothetical protein
LTKNGYGEMVVMSMEAFEHYQFESEIYFKLKEAELEAQTTNKRYSHKEVFDELRAKPGQCMKSNICLWQFPYSCKVYQTIKVLDGE